MLKRFIALFMAVMAVAIHADYLDEGFAAPPIQSRPQTWWHWIDCNITKEGIKADIDAMYKAGIGGFTILDIGQGIPEGDVKTLSPQWFGRCHDRQKPRCLPERRRRQCRTFSP